MASVPFSFLPLGKHEILLKALSIGLGFVSPVSAQAIHAYVVDSDGKGLTELGILGGRSSLACGINDAGKVVGKAQIPEGWVQAFIADRSGGSMTGLVEVQR
jgi:uncharacterized membrane protein